MTLPLVFFLYPLNNAHLFVREQFTLAKELDSAGDSETVTVYICAQLQEKKQLIISGTIDNSKEALSQLTVEDLRFLFHR